MNDENNREFFEMGDGIDWSWTQETADQFFLDNKESEMDFSGFDFDH